MKVLICEDEEIMLTALEFRLRKQGFEVLRAVDGEQAMQTLKEQEVDLIIADIMMPFISGIELIKHIRNIENSNTPVIVISALEHDEIVLEAFEAGANDFITKPFKPLELVLRIRRIVQELKV